MLKEGELTVSAGWVEIVVEGLSEDLMEKRSGVLETSKRVLVEGETDPEKTVGMKGILVASNWWVGIVFVDLGEDSVESRAMVLRVGAWVVGEVEVVGMAVLVGWAVVKMEQRMFLDGVGVTVMLKVDVAVELGSGLVLFIVLQVLQHNRQKSGKEQ